MERFHRSLNIFEPFFWPGTSRARWVIAHKTLLLSRLAGNIDHIPQGYSKGLSKLDKPHEDYCQNPDLAFLRTWLNIHYLTGLWWSETLTNVCGTLFPVLRMLRQTSGAAKHKWLLKLTYYPETRRSWQGRWSEHTHSGSYDTNWKIHIEFMQGHFLLLTIEALSFDIRTRTVWRLLTWEPFHKANLVLLLS